MTTKKGPINGSFFTLKEDQTHPVPLSVSRSYTPLLVILYVITLKPIRKVLPIHFFAFNLNSQIAIYLIHFFSEIRPHNRSMY